MELMARARGAASGPTLANVRAATMGHIACNRSDIAMAMCRLLQSEAWHMRYMECACMHGT